MAYGGYPTFMPQPYTQAYPQQPQPQMQQMMQHPMQQSVQQMQPNIICRPVASREEALSVPTDFSGAITIMPDFAHGFVYTKMLNTNDGSSIFHDYAMQKPAPPVEYAPMGALQALSAEIEQLKQAIADKPVKQPKGSAEK